MKLDSKALALAGGIVWGAAIFVATWWLIIIGSSGKTMNLLGRFYLGYKVAWWGSFVGLVWGFVDGFIAGLLIAWIYNMFVKPATS